MLFSNKLTNKLANLHVCKVRRIILFRQNSVWQMLITYFVKLFFTLDIAMALCTSLVVAYESLIRAGCSAGAVQPVLHQLQCLLLHTLLQVTVHYKHLQFPSAPRCMLRTKYVVQKQVYCWLLLHSKVYVNYNHNVINSHAIISFL